MITLSYLRCKPSEIHSTRALTSFARTCSSSNECHAQQALFSTPKFSIVSRRIMCRLFAPQVCAKTMPTALLTRSRTNINACAAPALLASFVRPTLMNVLWKATKPVLVNNKLKNKNIKIFLIKILKGGKCIDQLNGYYCDFGNKLGVSQSETIPIPCTLLDLSLDKQFFEVPSAGGNVFLQCTGVSQFVVSRCADMLFWNQEIKTCSIERPKTKTGVCLSYPCKNDGECNDLGEGKFQCLCRPGFTGQLCEQVIDFCASSPCKNDGKCVSHPAGYNCICKNKIVDDSCLSGELISLVFAIDLASIESTF